MLEESITEKEMSEKKDLLDRAKKLEPVLRIGKNGLTPGVVSEIKKQLLKKKLIKIKFLKPALEGKSRKEFAAEVVLKTDSELVQQVGFVIVLKKA